ncbi:chorismate synthase [Pseudalkalibacillus berkeleyi]|uniref:Chorismate synthase n=1 Tax=Pseudalkalibacillus berkeleyi TaxID=1069813 RepID=A0ABS9GY19_9BACL|nr:chorismate synthase [Pseudalkalibacillus berkeleyi]MCF6137574.1 chorismate synthase [Pseudalkalibacillus berkeleyi]
MRYLTAGESHGPQLTTIIEGMPANMTLEQSAIDTELKRRQKGYGRGRRMQIESDSVQLVGGVRHGKTTGAPIAMTVENKDWKHWQKIMGSEPISEGEQDEMKRVITKPRPGHADLNGAIKYNHRDMRNVLERSSARETTVRVAAGAVAKSLLSQFGVKVAGHVISIGGIKSAKTSFDSIEDLQDVTEQSPVRCYDADASEKMKEAIDEAKKNGDSIGGIVEVIVEGLPVGLGSHVHYDRKLDAKIAGAIMSINAFKGVEFGIGFEAAQRPGSEVHDEILWNHESGYYRKTNNLGGFEGGMTNGMPVIVRGVMKPIPTLYKPLQSVDIDTKETFEASIERSDSCAVPSASVVAEAVVAWELANAFTEKFGNESMDRMLSNYHQYVSYSKEF